MSVPQVVAGRAACAALRWAVLAVAMVTTAFFGGSPALRADAKSEFVALKPTMDARLKLEVPVDEWGGIGFLPVKVVAENGTNETCVWQFDFDVGTQTGATHRRRDEGLTLHSSFTVTAPARTTRTTVFWLPGGGADDGRARPPHSYGHTPYYGVSLDMAVQGTGVVHAAISTSLLHSWRSRTNGVFVALSQSLYEELRARLVKVGTSGSTGLPSTSLMKAEEWPTDWRVWSPFSIVTMTDNEFDRLDAARQTALRDWVALGGKLFLKPTSPAPSASAPRGLAASPESSVRHGLGMIVKSAVPTSMLVPAGAGTGTAAPASAGTVTAEPETVRPISEWEIRESRERPWKSVMEWFDADERGRMGWLAVSMGTGWLITFLLLFGVLVGPVNLFRLAPAGKRHRLFFTVPLISLGASAVLTLVIVFHDGIGGDGARRALVLLLPGENKAVIAQQQISRTGMLLGKNFAVAEDVLLAKAPPETGIRIPGKRMFRQTPPAGAAGAATGDWFTSRATESHVLMQIVPTRGRVELLSGGGGSKEPPVVQSSLPGTLRDFAYIDGGLNLWTADAVPPGRRVALTFSPLNHEVTWPPILKEFTKRERGHFYAAMDGCELAPIPTLGAIRWRDDKVFVTGRADAAAARDARPANAARAEGGNPQ